MKSSILILSSLASLCLAAPTQTTSFQWSPELAEFYSAVDHHIQQARGLGLTQQSPTCDLSKAVMPVAPTPLPSPDPGFILRAVAIGRGVQNYTCAEASPDYTPVSIGAVASLYNASCIAANYPDILALLPSLALQFPIPPSQSSALAPMNIGLCGLHYFDQNVRPVFNLNVSPDPAQQLGNVVARKVASSTAPKNILTSVGNGAVAWLYLQATDATQGNVKAVYRVYTAGGSPPKTCENSDAEFSVQYSAAYFIYSGL